MPQPVPVRREIRASRGQVFAAADRALKAGRRPTQDGIRTDLGGGSLNSINLYLNEWYQDLGSRLSRSEEPVKGVPSEASDLLLQLWRLAIKTTGAGKTTDAESEELRIMRSQRDAAMAQASALQTLNAELTRHRTTAERSLAEARALLMRREASLEEERAAKADHEREKSALGLESAILRERLAQVRARAPRTVRISTKSKKANARPRSRIIVKVPRERKRPKSVGRKRRRSREGVSKARRHST